MNYNEFPDPLHETIKWVSKFRPDIKNEISYFLNDRRFHFVISLAFTAGRIYGEKKK